LRMDRMAVGRSVIVIEASKLRTFLNQNQLVQANAIVQKLEVIFENHVTTSQKPEEHEYWKALVACQAARSHILSGNKDAALGAATEMIANI